MLNAFDRSNPNNLGIAWHLMQSLGRVMLGFVARGRGRGAVGLHPRAVSPI